MEWQSQSGRSLEDRKKAFEAKYKLDQEVAFKVEARRAKLIGRWAAERLGLEGEPAEAYARAAVELDMAVPAHAGLIGKLKADLRLDDAAVTAEMEQLLAVARQQILAELKT